MNTTTNAPNKLNPGDKPNSDPQLNTQSTKPVAPGSGVTAVQDPDNPKPKAPTPPDQGTGSAASDQAFTNKTAATKLPGSTEDDQSETDIEFEKARLEKDNFLSVQDQQAIDALHGASPEIERGDKSYLHAAAHSEYDSLDSDVKTIRERDRNIGPRLERFVADSESPYSIITKLVRDVPADTPDEHIVWGASGHKLRMGHLRALVMGIGGR